MSTRTVKVIAFPRSLYDIVREAVESEDGCSNRGVLHAAVEAHLEEVEMHCAAAGFAPSEGERHLVRSAINAADVEKLQEVAERSGVDVSSLIFLCLRHYFGVRLIDKGRKKIAAVAPASNKKKAAKKKA